MAVQDKELGLSHQLEALKGPVIELMRSKFGLLSERVNYKQKE